MKDSATPILSISATPLLMVQHHARQLFQRLDGLTDHAQAETESICETLIVFIKFIVDFVD